jgi:DNA-binding protein HU-beta
MNKSEFIDKVAEKAEMSRAAAARAVEAIFDTASGAVSEAVHQMGELSIPGFGKFTKKTRPARKGRNPRTGQEIDIPERATVSFSAGKNFREGVPSGRRGSTAAPGAPGTGGAGGAAGRGRPGAAKTAGSPRGGGAGKTGGARGGR